MHRSVCDGRQTAGSTSGAAGKSSILCCTGGQLEMQLRRSEHRKVLRGMRCEKAGGGLDLPIPAGHQTKENSAWSAAQSGREHRFTSATNAAGSRKIRRIRQNSARSAVIRSMRTTRRTDRVKEKMGQSMVRTAHIRFITFASMKTAARMKGEWNERYSGIQMPVLRRCD